MLMGHKKQEEMRCRLHHMQACKGGGQRAASTKSGGLQRGGGLAGRRREGLHGYAYTQPRHIHGAADKGL